MCKCLSGRREPSRSVGSAGESSGLIEQIFYTSRYENGMKIFLNCQITFFFWIQNFYSATSKLVLSRIGPRQSLTLYYRRHMAIIKWYGQGSLVDIWVAACPKVSSQSCPVRITEDQSGPMYPNNQSYSQSKDRKNQKLQAEVERYK